MGRAVAEAPRGPVREYAVRSANITPASVYAAAETRLRRPLTRGERAIDIVQADRDLADGKDRIQKAIDREKRRVIRKRARDGRNATMRVTPEVDEAMRWVYNRGREHALNELERLGIPPIRRRFREVRLPARILGFRARIKTGIGKVDVRLDREIGGRTGAAAGSAFSREIERALDRAVPGARAAAADVVSGLFAAGLSDVFEAHDELVGGWEYSAVMDEGTCDPCASLDGETFATIQDLYEVLPDFGPNPECDGGDRCRCRGVPSGEAQPAQAEPGIVGGGGAAATGEGEAAAAAQAVEQELASVIAGETILLDEARTIGGSSINEVYRVRLENGDQLVVKVVDPEQGQMRGVVDPGKDAERELSAYRMSQWVDRLGAAETHVTTPETTLGKARLRGYDHDSVFSRYVVNGHDAWDDSDWVMARRSGEAYDPAERARLFADSGFTEEQIRSMSLFDAIIGNTDRHRGNFLIESSRTSLGADVHLIDHGLAFPDRFDFHWQSNGNREMMMVREAIFGKELNGVERDLLANMQANREAITEDLRKAGLPDQAIERMWWRVEWMQEHGEIGFGPTAAEASGRYARPSP